MVIFGDLIGCTLLFNIFLSRMILLNTRSARIEATVRITATTMPAMAPGARAGMDLEILGLADAGRGPEVVAGAPS